MASFGVRALFLTDDCVDVFHPKTVNASAGALAHISIYHEIHWSDWLTTSKYPVLVLDPLAAHTINDVKTKDAFILICGSEGRGIQNELIKSVRLTPVSISMTDDVESLNAAVSVSISLHQLIRT